MIVPIVKEVYTELVADPAISFTVQTRGSHGIEIAIADALPGPSETGILIPSMDPPATRDYGTGKVFGRIPSNAPYDTGAAIVFTGGA